VCPYAAILLLPLCRTSSSLWWSPSFSFFFFILLHAQVVIATLLLPRCSSSFSSTSHAVVVLLFSFLFLHFLRHCGSSSSSSLCRFTPLVLLLLPSWVLNVVNIGLMLLFEAMPQTKMTFFWKNHIRIINPYGSYGSSISMVHTDHQSLWSIRIANLYEFFFVK